jgi:type III secretion protein V
LDRRVKAFAAHLKTGDVAGLLARYGDLLLAALVVGMVGMMILPLPTFLLDILITLNIAASVILLLVAIYVSDALRIATFPTILLLTTLYRLALNVSSTRLILLQANAGRVIRAFGTFVVRGNYVVGAVVFLILTIIQYLVIARGGERIAEVAARFTLDAMPGKQMAIDADVRAGTIDSTEARRRRAQLSREAQLYGSMDGAMKFVKGDAIAGILITLINIVGGLVIGITQRGLEVGEAARTYTLLTIGDGLVSQIPALLLSTAAGLVVTRVASEDEGTHLGHEIGTQVLGQPRALAIAALLLALLGVVPGLPLVPFWILAAATGGTAWAVSRTRSQKQAAARAAPFAPGLAALVLDVGDDLWETASAPAFAVALGERLYADLGVPLPALQVRPAGAALAPRGWLLQIKEIPIEPGRVADPGALVAAVGEALRHHAAELLGIEEVQHLLDGLATHKPALVHELVPARLELRRVADVLRRLVAEDLSIRNLADILEALGERVEQQKEPGALVEQVRAHALRRYITHKYAAGGRLEAYLLEPAVEEALREALRDTPAGQPLLLEPDLSQDLVAAVRARLGSADPARPVIVTSAELRPHLRSLVVAVDPDIAVLSFGELSPALELVPRGHIGLG